MGVIVMVGKGADERFWVEEGHRHLRPDQARQEFPGGFDLVGAVRGELGGYGSVLEVGCGEGRLAVAFGEGQYRGLDVSAVNVGTARRAHPGWRFEVCGWLAEYPVAEAVLVYGVLLHIPDGEVGGMVGRLTRAAREVVLVGEILGREWRSRPGSRPPVYSRARSEYEALFGGYGWVLASEVRYPYAWYVRQGSGRNTDLSLLRFEPDPESRSL